MTIAHRGFKVKVIAQCRGCVSCIVGQGNVVGPTFIEGSVFWLIIMMIDDLIQTSVCVGCDGIETATFAARLLAVNAVARDLLPGYCKPLLPDALHDTLSLAVSQILFVQQFHSQSALWSTFNTLNAGPYL